MCTMVFFQCFRISNDQKLDLYQNTDYGGVVTHDKKTKIKIATL